MQNESKTQPQHMLLHQNPDLCYEYERRLLAKEDNMK